MYYEAIRQFVQALKNIDVWLDKAEEHAAAKTFDIDVLLTSRLAPDMAHFIYQVQSACDYVKGACGWLSGRTPPRHSDDETTIDEVRARIAKTIAFVESVPEAQYAEAADRKVLVSWSPSDTFLYGQDYLLQVAIPNVYFHVMTAYVILRHNGVDLNKASYMGPVRWLPAQSGA